MPKVSAILYPSRPKASTARKHSTQLSIRLETPGVPRKFHISMYATHSPIFYRRVEPSGRTIGEFLRDEISLPLSADAFIGLREDQLQRMAEVKGWKVRKVALESCVPAKWGRRIEPSALDLYRVMRRLRRKRVVSAVNRPPVIEGTRSK